MLLFYVCKCLGMRHEVNWVRVPQLGSSTAVVRIQIVSHYHFHSSKHCARFSFISKLKNIPLHTHTKMVMGGRENVRNIPIDQRLCTWLHRGALEITMISKR